MSRRRALLPTSDLLSEAEALHSGRCEQVQVRVRDLRVDSDSFDAVWTVVVERQGADQFTLTYEVSSGRTWMDRTWSEVVSAAGLAALYREVQRAGHEADWTVVMAA